MAFHIVMFPWLAFGHLIPFFHLSKLLAQRGNRVTFISTPRNIQRLPKIPPKLASLLCFIELQLPHVEHLPPHAEATTDLPLDQVPHLKIAFDLLQSPFADLLQTLSPDWLIHDFAPHWLPPIAAKLQLPCAFFSIYNASDLAFLGSPADYLDETPKKPEDFTVPPKWAPFLSFMAFRTFEIRRIFGPAFVVNDSGVRDTFRLGTILQSCDIVAVRGCTEFEPEALNLLQEKLYRKPVFPVGLLMPEVDQDADEADKKWVVIKKWLDKQESKSVVYMAFGSEASLSQEEATELALGLELSGLPFFWVLRNPTGLTESSLLPSGFEERVKGRGIVWRSWVPQMRILSHRAIGGSLMHSGWSSVVESIGFGHPLILFPMVHDQALLARLLDWKKVGLDIPRNDEDGSFTKETVADSLKKVMVDSEGEVYRSNAREWSKVFTDKGRQDRYVDDFVHYLKEHCREKSGTHGG